MWNGKYFESLTNPEISIKNDGTPKVNNHGAENKDNDVLIEDLNVVQIPTIENLDNVV